MARWTNAGSLPAEFVKCVSAEEMRVRLGGGRPFSAALIDGTLPALDRDLIEAADAAGCRVIVVGTLGRRDWVALGAAALLPATFDRRELLETLVSCSRRVERADGNGAGIPTEPAGWMAPVIAVTGPGGTGASTVAIALAQGCAADTRAAGYVLLADLCLDAEQSMLHDARDGVPGVQELVDAFRSGRPTVAEIRALTLDVEDRGYHLLLGLRRSRSWATVRPRAFEAALVGLRRAHRVVVADVDAQVEGEGDGGSIEVEERNVMARTTLAHAHAVFVVGHTGVKGLHSMTRVLGDVLAFGVAPGRVVSVINRAPRSARARADLTRTLTQLLPTRPDAPTPIFLPERRVDEAIRDGVRIPASLVSPLMGAYRAVSSRCGPGDGPRGTTGPQLVVPGSLGAWASELAGERE